MTIQQQIMLLKNIRTKLDKYRKKLEQKPKYYLAYIICEFLDLVKKFDKTILDRLKICFDQEAKIGKSEIENIFQDLFGELQRPCREHIYSKYFEY